MIEYCYGFFVGEKMNEALYVIMGMAIWAMITMAFGVCAAIAYIKQVEKTALVMLATVIQDIEYIKMLKYKTMVEEEVNENTIKVTKNIDEENFRRWKEVTIKNLISVYPDKYKSTIKYHDWKSAMEWLQAQTKRGKHAE